MRWRRLKSGVLSETSVHGVGRYVEPRRSVTVNIAQEKALFQQATTNNLTMTIVKTNKQ